MPQKTVYIRDKDLAKWKALENKAAWLSKKLNENPLTKGSHEEQKTDTTELILEPEFELTIEPTIESTIELAIEPTIKPKIIHSKKQLDLTSILAAKRIKTCSHGYAKGLCKFGC